MANSIVLGLLELVAIASCAYGFYILYAVGNASIIGMFYSGLWFILGMASNICGLLALGYLHYGEEEEYQQTSQYFVQYHYLLAWMTIVIGYPSFITQTWMTYYPTPFAHLHVILSVIPLVAWIQRKTGIIVLTTQVATIAAICSHVYISYCAWNIWGLIGAATMVINVIALSMPTRYNLLGFTSRELYVTGLAATSYILCLAVGEAMKNPKQVKLLVPW